MTLVGKIQMKHIKVDDIGSFTRVLDKFVRLMSKDY